MSEPTLYVSDPDFTLWQGDVLDTLRHLPDESVDCCVTSPPYWGLRDYGTGQWEGGDPDCDHKKFETRDSHERKSSTLGGGTDTIRVQEEASAAYRETCGKCGATRVDRQIGLEATPAEFVQRMVDVFREVRRVLAPHGTCWINLGDSYANPPASGTAGQWNGSSPLGSNRNAEATAEGSRKTGGTLAEGLKQKDLCGVPWRVAFALQDDGWWLRSDIVWSKPNPMPESVTDRPTKAHEYVFLLTKQPRYWFDQEAVREPHKPSSIACGEYGHGSAFKGQFNGSPTDDRHQEGKQYARLADAMNPAGRNIRSVWSIATQPYAEAHFATFPQELPRRCIAAGCPEWVCRTCGKARERIISVTYENPGNRSTNGPRSIEQRHETAGFETRLEKRVTTDGWSDCGHGVVSCSDCKMVVPHAVRRPGEAEGISAALVSGARTGQEPEVAGEDVRELRGDVLRQEVSADMLPIMWGTSSGDGGTPALVPEEVGRIHDESRVPTSLHAGASDGDRAREEMGAGTSSGDGESSRSDAGVGRACASPERSEGRQQDREPGTCPENGASRRSAVSSLPPHIQCDVDACPSCGGSLRYDTPNYRPGVVLDPFMGSGTTALVARNLGRHSIGIELNREYADLCARRLQQLSLLA